MADAVRTIEPAELDAWRAAVRSGFLMPPGEAKEPADQDLARTWAAFAGDRVVGTLRSFPTTLTVPGGAVEASAVSAVTVQPTHRRRGLLTAMVRADLDLAAARGEAVSALIASEWPIYGRFGYGPATEHQAWLVDPRAARFAVPGAGDVLEVEPAELRAVAPALFSRVAGARPGAISRDDGWWDRALGLARGGVAGPEPPGVPRLAVVRDAGGAPVGYLRFVVDACWEDRTPAARLTVVELVAATDGAEARLWRFACEVDLVAAVRAVDRPVDDLLPWLLEDARVARAAERMDLLWVRPLDVPAALAARRYATEGRVVLEVADPLGHAAGRFALEAGPQEAVCATTGTAAELALDVGALGAAYLGGTRLTTLARAGRVRELAPGALVRADAMLAWPVAPWCSTWF